VTLDGGTVVRQPALATSALLGVLVGIKGGYDLLWVAASKRRQQNSPKGQQQQGNDQQGMPATRLWALAFFAFGAMNLSALPLHCFLPAPETTYPQESPMWWSIDTYMTGASSMCLAMAALQECVDASSTSTVSTTWKIKFAFRKLGQIFHSIGALCLVWFWLDPTPLGSPLFGLEDWYLFPPLLAGLPVSWFLFQQRKFISKSSGHFVFCLGSLTAAASIVLDRFFCYLLEARFLDAFTASNGVFLGCDLCFLGLYLVLVASTSYAESYKKVS